MFESVFSNLTFNYNHKDITTLYTNKFCYFLNISSVHRIEAIKYIGIYKCPMTSPHQPRLKCPKKKNKFDREPKAIESFQTSRNASNACTLSCISINICTFIKENLNSDPLHVSFCFYLHLNAFFCFFLL